MTTTLRFGRDYLKALKQASDGEYLAFQAALRSAMAMQGISAAELSRKQLVALVGIALNLLEHYPDGVPPEVYKVVAASLAAARDA